MSSVDCVVLIHREQGLRLLFSDGSLLTVQDDEENAWANLPTSSCSPRLFATWIAAHEENGWERLT